MGEPADWGQLTSRLRDGDLVCPEHGRQADAGTGPVPVCPVCGMALLRVRRRPGRAIEFDEPMPATCAGPDRHPLAGGRVLVGWQNCMCPAGLANGHGHRRWTCRACGDEQLWPPCQGQA